MLDDGDHGFVELLGKFPTGIEIDEVVEAELLALKLGCTGNAEARAIGIEGGALMGIFAVAQRLSEGKIDPQRGGECRFVGIGRASGRGGLGHPVKGVGDGRVIGRGGREGQPGEPPAGFTAQAAVGFLEFLNEGRVIGDAGDDGHVFKVFSGGADHGGTADIDVLDEVTEGNAGWVAVFSKA